jgi:hypothetical protein
MGFRDPERSVFAAREYGKREKLPCALRQTEWDQSWRLAVDPAVHSTDALPGRVKRAWLPLPRKV